MWKQAFAAICGAVFGIALIVTCSSPGSDNNTVYDAFVDATGIDIPLVKDVFAPVDIGVKDAGAATPGDCQQWEVLGIGLLVGAPAPEYEGYSGYSTDKRADTYQVPAGWEPYAKDGSTSYFRRCKL